MMLRAAYGAWKRRNAVGSPLTAFGAKVMSWHRADLGITQSGGYVSLWADQSGNGRDFGQSYAPRQPQTGGTWAGQTALTFTAANFTLVELNGHGTSYGSPSALHVIRLVSILNDPPAGTPAGGLDGFGAFAGAQIEFPYTSRDIYDSTGANSRVNCGNAFAALGIALTGTVVYESTSTASAFKAKVNGQSLYSGASLGVGVWANPEIGADSRSVRALNGTLAEHIVLNAEPSAGERAAFAAYVLARYGLTIV